MLPKPFTGPSLLGVAAGLGLSWSCVMQPLQAATDVALVSGAFRRSIPVKEIEHLAKTGEAIGLLGDLLELSKQEPQEVTQMLNQSLQLPLVLTSRLINTRIGEAILRHVLGAIDSFECTQKEYGPNDTNSYLLAFCGCFVDFLVFIPLFRTIVFIPQWQRNRQQHLKNSPCGPVGVLRLT